MYAFKNDIQFMDCVDTSWDEDMVSLMTMTHTRTANLRPV